MNLTVPIQYATEHDPFKIDETSAKFLQRSSDFNQLYHMTESGAVQSGT